MVPLLSAFQPARFGPFLRRLSRFLPPPCANCGVFAKVCIVCWEAEHYNTFCSLNILGFLDLSATGNPKYKYSGNVGMLDVVAALEWIQENISAFGESGGGGKVGTRTPGTPMMWGFGPTPDGEILLQQPFQPDFADISSNQ